MSVPIIEQVKKSGICKTGSVLKGLKPSFQLVIRLAQLNQTHYFHTIHIIFGPLFLTLTAYKSENISLSPSAHLVHSNSN
jgi:hypothetical protein